MSTIGVLNILPYFFASSQAMLLKKWIYEGMQISPTDLGDLYMEVTGNFLNFILRAALVVVTGYRKRRRVRVGVSAGVFVVGFTMIRDMFDQKKAGFYLGLVGTMMSIAMGAAPLLGGLVIDNIGWRVWCWIVFVVLVAAAVMILVFGIKATKEQVADMAIVGGSFDFAGGAAVTVFLAMLILFCLLVALIFHLEVLPHGE